MKLNRKSLMWITRGLAVGLLLSAYLAAGYWQMAVGLAVTALTAWTARRALADRLPAVLLSAYIAAAACGVLLGALPAMLIAGAALALAGWEMAGAPAPVPGDPLAERASERASLALLVVSVGAGLLIAEAGLWVRLRLPFAGVLLAALLTVFGLARFVRSVRDV